ncbi:hypothetical protein [Providencia rettgeri]|uniref:hypothetical protein n=1 Tax=Providencia rettgeri TaxID=587 RepID=UPI001CFB42A8|nr:hypothetical protein [Providencia rettgeri]MCB4815131.1 hypothetical protein [Providencia rettgeri]MCJ2287718.1 hypothetical protein [Providencia rettgeri]
MDFDWIAGTALVVGIGSLYLTYQSTKSAKRAIETSIELYEREKNDAAAIASSNNEKELMALLKVTSYKAASMCDQIYYLCSMYLFIKEWSLKSVEFKDINGRNLIILWRSDKVNVIEFNRINIEISENLLTRSAALSPEAMNGIIELRNQASIIDNKIGNVIYYASQKNKESIINSFDNDSGIIKVLNDAIDSLSFLEPYINEYETYTGIKGLLNNLN